MLINDFVLKVYIHRTSVLPAALLVCLIAGCSGNGTTGMPDAAGVGSPDAAMAVDRQLTILYTNDEHSHLYAFGPEGDDHPPATMAGTGMLKGGVARRQVVLTVERKAALMKGAETLTVSAGDNAMGTLAQVAFPSSAPDYRIMSQLGYDVGCLGNHEFDFGPAALASAIGAAVAGGGAPQLVASNIHFSAGDKSDDTLAALYGEVGETKPLKRAHIITTKSGLKVGFFGILGSEAAYQAPFKTPVTGSGALAEESNFELVRPKIYADLQPVVDALRAAKVDLVVALSHSGVNLDFPERGDDYNIALNVTGIDVIVSGHSHTVVPKPIHVKNTKSGKDVTIVQAGSYGRFVGRLPLTVKIAGDVVIDDAAAMLVPVDDTTIPDPALATAVENVTKGLESDKGGGGMSFLEAALSRVLGMKVMHDATKVGDLYFFPLGKTTFSVPGQLRYVETNLLDLAADAQLSAATAALGNEVPDVGLQAAGVIRADLDKGKTGTITFGDAFRAFPLGFSPYDGTVGYPLVHAYIAVAELKAAFELSASLGLTNDSFFLGASGVRATYDTTRPAFDFKGSPLDPQNGRVTKLEFDSQHKIGAETYDTVLFDINRHSPDEWTGPNYNALSLIHVVTNLYIASFATAAGVTLKDKNANALKIDKTILRRADNSEVKDYEAFAGYLRKLSVGNGGTLPSLYDPTSPTGKLPRRLQCTGPLCGKY